MSKARLGKAEVRLTAKQQRFVEEYPVDLNATQAAVRAGYSRHTADRIASRLLRHPRIAALLAKHAARRGEQLNLTVERLEAELARIAYVDPRRLRGDGGRVLELHELDEDTARAVQSVKVRVAKIVRGRDAAKFAETLGVETPEGQTVEEVVLGTVETKFHPKVEAISIALKRLGALVERHELALGANSDVTDPEWEHLAVLFHRLRAGPEAPPAGGTETAGTTTAKAGGRRA